MRNSVNSIIEQYNKEVDALPEIHSRGGGAARNASGLVYENLIKRTCIFSNLDPKKNDYFRTKEINGKSLRTLQVDWHVYNDGKLTKLVESKTYLDRCYLERAVTDFIKLMNEKYKDFTFVFHSTKEYSQLIDTLILVAAGMGYAIPPPPTPEEYEDYAHG
mgnify:CR=1 FL=1